jgi:S-adenosylmethionine decarboxylase
MRTPIREFMQNDEIHNTEALHFILDLYDIENYEILDNKDLCLQMTLEAINKAGCGILNIYTHKFEPQGLSINITLSESHCAIHTWPEKKYCAIDLYGCGNINLKTGIDHFINILKPQKKSVVRLERGNGSNLKKVNDE